MISITFDMKALLSNYKTEILAKLLDNIDDIIVESTDDTTKLVSRILTTAIENGVLTNTNITLENNERPTDTDFAKIAVQLMLFAKEVTLQEPIFEPHVRISKTGQFEPYKIIVPQVDIQWRDMKKRSGKNHYRILQTHLHFPDGSIDLISELPIR